MPTDALAALYLGLEHDPGDKLTLHALADWYEENARPEAAAALRWVLRRGHCPFRYSREAITVHGLSWQEGWYWWGHNGQYDQNWGHPASCRLPAGVWDKLRHGMSTRPLVFKEYATPRDAYEALIEIWPLVEHLVDERFRGTRR